MGAAKFRHSTVRYASGVAVTLVLATTLTSATGNAQGATAACDVRNAAPVSRGEMLDVVVHDTARLGIPSTAATSLVLYIDGYPLASAPMYATRRHGQPVALRYRLISRQQNRETWQLLYETSRLSFRPTRIGLGPDAKSEAVSCGTVQFKAVRNASSIEWIIYLLLLASAIWLLFGTDALREPPSALESSATSSSREVHEPKADWPVSLGLSQMAFWTIIVVASFGFLYLVTGEFNAILTSQAIVLMGVSSATALASAGIGKTKRENARTQLAQLRAQLRDGLGNGAAGETASMHAAQPLEREIKYQLGRLGKPMTSGYFAGLLNDRDGVALHRAQLLVWTLALGIVFVVEVLTSLAMPEFDATLTVLLGIGSGAYLGFKIPESHSLPSEDTPRLGSS